ncbi:hypothetical protein PtB15_1B590 [Puccinia triticina]|nr:hypothetical protein PtB15_1B590 [Puccinia triticina]
MSPTEEPKRRGRDAGDGDRAADELERFGFRKLSAANPSPSSSFPTTLSIVDLASLRLLPGYI